jgi:hypothetical protein
MRPLLPPQGDSEAMIMAGRTAYRPCPSGRWRDLGRLTTSCDLRDTHDIQGIISIMIDSENPIRIEKKTQKKANPFRKPGKQHRPDETENSTEYMYPDGRQRPLLP